ncbi:hypothetical protein GRF29_69g1473632 [Pseudopithomyces chartarum]|uniref:Uncharacterized protein n=1 Tax=Pseudopithomyces chartarum TaxID=1892770 RepID=A0AAN6RH89_9PLEO|nr:hypothetical protein GRF29_69g1473632 [Pseudopithomyces chartarum]
MATPDGYDNFTVQSLAFPYHQYISNNLEPCAIASTEKNLPIHMLNCGHLVAINNSIGPDDNRCGLNCLHVANWMKQQSIKAAANSVNVHTGNAQEYNVLPEPSKFLSQHSIYCEICYGIPASSFFVGDRETSYKRALALTRTVIEHYTGYNQAGILDRLCPSFSNPKPSEHDWKLVHKLRCGHEVLAQPARPCASNCLDSPACKCTIFPGNFRQGDVIFCHECTHRAELVYQRYANASKSVAMLGSKHGLNGVLVPVAAPDTLQGLDVPSAMAYRPNFSQVDDHEHAIAELESPMHPRLDQDSSFTG